MNKYKREYFRKRVIAFFVVAIMAFGCITPLSSASEVYAEDNQIVIQITGNKVTATADGTYKTAEGFTFECTSPLFDETKFRYDGDGPDEVPKVTQKEVGIYPMGIEEEDFIYDDDTVNAVFEITDGELAIYPPNPEAVTNIKGTAGYEKINLSWNKVSSNYGNVKYEVRYFGKPICRGRTENAVEFGFDPYPEDAKGNARPASFEVYAFIDATIPNYVTGENITKRFYSKKNYIKNIPIVHPMYVVIKTKRKANIYGSPGSGKAVATAAKGSTYVAIGGSRIDGENKRVVIKMNGKLRYIKSSDVNFVSMKYNSKTEDAFKPAVIENFVNTANGGKPIESNPKTKSYPKRLILVGTYNQRVYLFDWKNNKWAVNTTYKWGIPCNTGKELTPYGQFKISNKWAVKESTGTRWWCIFNSVGIHEQLGDALGKPASGGCVRIPDAIAKDFYKDKVKVGYTVLVY